MKELSVAQLAALDNKAYTAQIKARLRDDEAWVDLLDPVLVERTRADLLRMVHSIEVQKQRAAVREETPDPHWLVKIDALRRLVMARLNAMAPAAPVEPPPATSREARAWRAFSARLATALDEGDPTALDRLKTPYGGMTAREWLAAREEKKGEQ